VYQDEVNSDATINDAREAFQGKYDSERAWAEQWLEDTGGLQGCPEHLKNYIDFEAYARDAMMRGLP
jgi:antirestriction protein